MATGFDNPQPVQDGALFFLRDRSGQRQLFLLEGVNHTFEGSVTNIPGPAGMIGSQRAPGGHSISFTTRRARGANPEARWETLLDGDEVFRFEIQFLFGDRWIFPQCRVSTANTSADNGGSVQTEVTLVCPIREIVGA